MTAERIKEELQWLRAMFPVAVAIVAGLVAYIVQPTTPRALASLAVGIGVVCVGVVVFVVASVYRLLKQLE